MDGIVEEMEEEHSEEFQIQGDDLYLFTKIPARQSLQFWCLDLQSGATNQEAECQDLL